MMVISVGRSVKRKAPVTLAEFEQRVKGERVRRRGGLFDPELAEQRKLFPRLVAGADRKAARGEAERLGVRTGAIEARALKDRNVLEALV